MEDGREIKLTTATEREVADKIISMGVDRRILAESGVTGEDYDTLYAALKKLNTYAREQQPLKQENPVTENELRIVFGGFIAKPWQLMALSGNTGLYDDKLTEIKKLSSVESRQFYELAAYSGNEDAVKWVMTKAPEPLYRYLQNMTYLSIFAFCRVDTTNRIKYSLYYSGKNDLMNWVLASDNLKAVQYLDEIDNQTDRSGKEFKLLVGEERIDAVVGQVQNLL